MTIDSGCPKCSHKMIEHIEAAGVQWCLVPGCECQTVGDTTALLTAIRVTQKHQCRIVLGRPKCAFCGKTIYSGKVSMIDDKVVHYKCRMA